MNLENDPRLTLAALALFHEPDQPEFKKLRSVLGEAAAEIAQLVQIIRQRKFVAPSKLSLTAKGVDFLKVSVPATLLLKGQEPRAVYRAFVGSALLSHPADTASFKVLSDGRSVCAGLAARLMDGDVRLPFEDANAVLAIAVRTVVREFLTRSVPALKLSQPTSSTISKDPLTVDLFAAATGHRDWDAGFRKLAALALNTSSIPKTEARWRKLSKAGFDSMARLASHKQQDDADASAMVGVIDRISRTAPTGWVAIFKAFEAYRETKRISLADFKLAVEAAARSDKLELAPLNVPSLLDANERAQSALVMGGLTYHLVRLPK